MFIQELEKILKETIKEVGFDSENIRIIKSNRPELCDYQCDDAFKLAKIHHKSPIEIGEAIVSKMNEKDLSDYFSKVEFIKPGFINMTLSDEFINKTLNKMIENDLDIDKPENPETFVLDYGGPNVAKPLHVGHLRPAIIGESVKRIIAFKGHKTIGDVHLGDYGLQIGQVIYGIKEDGLKVNEITLEYLEETYPKISKICKENEEILEACRRITKELQNGNPEYQELWKKICEISIKDIKRIYDKLGVSFDLWNGESDSYPYMKAMFELLENNEVIVNSDNAKIIEVKEADDKKDVPPLILEKSDGAYLYSTTDLATIYERMQNHNPNHILYVVDARQQLHFEQVFRAAQKGKIVADKAMLEHIWFGTMNGLDGKPFKTRDGSMLKLDALFGRVKEQFLNLKEENKEMAAEDIDKIANAIIKFADLQNNRERNYIFDIEKFSEVVGKTGPYILYTYLRIDKLLTENDGLLNETIYNNTDRELRTKLLELNFAVDNSFEERMPHYIADYLYDLCVVANSFYQNNHLSNLEDETKKNEWLTVLKLTNRVLKQLLDLLIIEIPTKM